MRFLLPLLCLAILLSGCVFRRSDAGSQSIALVGPNHAAITLTVEIADEPSEQEKGLMGREVLAEGAGMLFLFPTSEVRSFWMKDTMIPLDILFFDAQGKVVEIKTMVPCEADPCPQYSSEKPTSIALEVAAGFAERSGVDATWRIALPSTE